MSWADGDAGDRSSGRRAGACTRRLSEQGGACGTAACTLLLPEDEAAAGATATEATEAEAGPMAVASGGGGRGRRTRKGRARGRLTTHTRTCKRATGEGAMASLWCCMKMMGNDPSQHPFMHLPHDVIPSFLGHTGPGSLSGTTHVISHISIPWRRTADARPNPGLQQPVS